MSEHNVLGKEGGRVGTPSSAESMLSTEGSLIKRDIPELIFLPDFAPKRPVKFLPELSQGTVADKSVERSPPHIGPPATPQPDLPHSPEGHSEVSSTDASITREQASSVEAIGKTGGSSEDTSAPTVSKKPEVVLPVESVPRRTELITGPGHPTGTHGHAP